MEQYIEYIKQTIIDAISNTTDEEILNMIYGLLMNNINAENTIQKEMLQSHF